MAEKKQKEEGEQVPPERWSVEKPFDSADYLEGEPPTYATGDGPFGEFAGEPEAGKDSDD